MVTKKVKTKRIIIYSFAYQVDEDYEDYQSLLVNKFMKTQSLCSIVENVSYKTILKGSFLKYIKSIIYTYSLKLPTPKNYLYEIFK